jgi:hypothetical protein
MRIHLKAGAAVVLEQGEVMLGEPPCWLAERALFPKRRLREGEAWTAQRGGWTTVEALRHARFHCLRPVPAGAFARLAAWGRRLSPVALRRALAPSSLPASRR